MKNYAVVLLDETGSMYNQRDRVVSAMNEYVTDISQDTHLCVFKFGGSRWEILFDNAVETWNDITVEDYIPRGGTPLYDSVGKTIEHANSLAKKGDKVMLMIDTDGEENMSREFNQDNIKKLVEDKKEEGWAFLFMSSGLDVRHARVTSHNMASAIGINAVQNAGYAARRNHVHNASTQTMAYFTSSVMPTSVDFGEDSDDEADTEVSFNPDASRADHPTSEMIDEAAERRD